MSVGIIARLTWTRTLRSRALWITALLVVLPILFALLFAVEGASAGNSHEVVCVLVVRLMILLAAALHLAPAIADEVEVGTISYLWSRPVPRYAVLVGKIIAIAPILAIGFGAAIAISWGIAGSAGGDPFEGISLVRVELAAMAEIVGACAFAAGAGALFPKHPFVFVMAYVLLGEQLLSVVPGLGFLSVAHHALEAAGLPSGGKGEDLSSAVIGLAVLSAIWLGVGLWRLGLTEYVKVDQ